MKVRVSWLCIGVVLGLSVVTLPRVFAEQSGTTPNSGVTSYLKSTYDSITTLGYGSTSSGSWGNWGGMWNRIRSAAEWKPDSGLNPSEVLTGETFYSGSRSAQTGTADAPVDWSLLAHQDYGDGKTGDGEEEEGEWTQTNTSPEVWRDERMHLYWSANQGLMSNLFPNSNHSTCDFFALTDRGEYDGSDSDCGNAINTCGNLSIDADGDSVAETDWYLPSQKELFMAYVDGIHNQTNATFSAAASFWSSTELYWDGARAMWLDFHNDGNGSYLAKSTTNAVSARCVRRD